MTHSMIKITGYINLHDVEKTNDYTDEKTNGYLTMLSRIWFNRSMC